MTHFDIEKKVIYFGFTFLAIVAILAIFKPLFIKLLLVFLITSGANMGCYWWDKRAAQKDQRRIPENTLHGLSLFGGWPGAAFAQHNFRHKTKKTSFRVMFYLSALTNIAITITAFFSPGILQGIL